MSATGFGLRPIRTKTGRRFTGGGMNRYLIINNSTHNFYRGDPVKVSAGTLVPAKSGKPVLGVFMGASYVDSGNNLVMNEYMPSGVTIASGQKPIDAIHNANQPVGYVVDDPDMVFVIKADGTVSQSNFGQNAKVSIGTGSTVTKQSGARLKTASFTTSLDAGASAGPMVRLVRLWEVPGNSIGAANPLLEVIWIQHEDYVGAVS